MRLVNVFKYSIFKHLLNKKEKKSWGIDVPVQSMPAQGGVEFYSLLTSTLDGSGSASCLGRFTLGDRSPLSIKYDLVGPPRRSGIYGGQIRINFLVFLTPTSLYTD